jgi:tRNA pseudouridine55 synthase
MRVGFATDTYDATGVAQGPDRAGEFDLAKLEPLLAEFRGTIPQKPPAFSAKKIAGVAAYKKARKRQDVELPAVPVTISELLLIEAKGPLIRLSVTVSSGTYIRSLANDLGARLGVGAHLTELRRSSVGNFRLDQAARLEQLDQPGELERHLIPMENLLTTIPARSLDSGEVRAVLHGQPVAASSDASWLRLMAPDGRLVAMAQAESPGSYHPKVVLCEPTAETSASTPAGVVAAKAPAGSAAE